MIDIEEYLLAKFPGKRFNAAGNLHANCPFHDDNTKSFSITQTGMFICGSTKCGLKGNFAYFYKLSENVTWKQVQDELKESAPRDNLDMATLFVREEIEQAQIINPWPPNTPTKTSICSAMACVTSFAASILPRNSAFRWWWRLTASPPTRPRKLTSPSTPPARLAPRQR